MRGQFCRLRCRESLTTPCGAAACVAFEAGAIAHQSEILTFRTGLPHSLACGLAAPRRMFFYGAAKLGRVVTDPTSALITGCGSVARMVKFVVRAFCYAADPSFE